MKSATSLLERKMSAIWMMVGNISYALSQAALIAIISKFLGAEAVGIFSYALAVTAPIVVLTNLGLRTQVATDTDDLLSLQSACQFRYMTSILAVAISVSFAAVLQDDHRVLIPVLLIAISKAFESQADLSYGVLSKLNLHKSIAYSLVGRSCFGLIAAVGAIFLTGNINYVLGAYALAWMLAVFIFDRPPVSEAIQAQGKLTTTALKEFFIAGLPLGVSTFVINLSANAPKFMLEHQSGLTMLGVYSALFFIVQSGGIAINSIGQAFLPQLARHYSHGDYASHALVVLQALFVVFCISVIGGLVSFLFGEHFVRVIFGVEYIPYSDFLWVMFAFSPLQYSCSLFGYVFASTKRNYNILSIQLVNLTFSFMLSFLLISEHGVRGAVYAIPASSAITLIIYVAFYARLIRTPKTG